MQSVTSPVWLVMLLSTAFAGGIFIVLPRIGRRGLLFGVYVGEEASAGDAARSMIRSWQRRMAAWVALSLAGGILTVFASGSENAVLVPTLLLTTGYLAEYLRAHFRARALARPEGTPVAAAPLGPGGPRPLLLPPIAVGLGVAGGLFALAYSWSHYAALPAIVPTHFGPSGAPDDWRPKSLLNVMLLPSLTLVLGVGLGGVAILIDGAKRAIRYPDGGISIRAQERFRRAMARFMAWTALLNTIMLASMSIFAIRIGLGRSAAFPRGFIAFPVGIAVWVAAGVIYSLVRYGQGGSRLERAAARAPLTDGLADNRRWILGMFYVNRDDPSILVEHRFGLGYTLNFGNWKAVALLAAFLALTLGISLAALLAG